MCSCRVTPPPPPALPAIACWTRSRSCWPSRASGRRPSTRSRRGPASPRAACCTTSRRRRRWSAGSWIGSPDLIADDVERMRAAPAGPVDYFLRTSIPTDSRFERAIVAIARLAQAADTRARDALAGAQRLWLAVLEEAVGDPLAARMVMLIGDGMYYNTALLPAANTVLRDETDVDELIALVRRICGTDRLSARPPLSSSGGQEPRERPRRPVVRGCTDRRPERRRRLGRSARPDAAVRRARRTPGLRAVRGRGAGSASRAGQRDLRPGVGAVAEGDQSARAGPTGLGHCRTSPRRGGRSRASRSPPRSARSHAVRRSPPGARTARRRASAAQRRASCSPSAISSASQRDRSASRSVANSSAAVRRVA